MMQELVAIADTKWIAAPGIEFHESDFVGLNKLILG